jgi:DNA-binding response OmpR family regulator
MMHPPSGKLVLVIEDDPDLSSTLAEILRAEGYRARVATDGRSALIACDEERPELALLDWSLPEGNAEGLAHQLKERGVRVVIASGCENTQELGRRVDARATLSKPYDASALFQVLEQVLYS